MRALVYTGTRQIEIQDTPDPICANDGAVVKVCAAGICGSEVEAYLGKSRKRVPPFVMGHEFAGTVHSVGPDVENAQIDDRVAIQPLVSCHHCPQCREGRTNLCPNRKLMSMDMPGGHAEYAAVPASALYQLPADVDFVAATLIEPLANAVHILARTDHTTLDKLVVVGGGTIGAVVVALAKTTGIDSIAVVEPNPAKHDKLAALGAEMVVDPRDQASLDDVLDWSAGGSRLVVDASGAASARKFAIDCAGPGATVLFVGQASGSCDADHRDIVAKELAVKGSYGYTDADFSSALRVLAEGKVSIGKITRVIPMHDAPQAFAELASGRSPDIKIIILP